MSKEAETFRCRCGKLKHSTRIERAHIVFLRVRGEFFVSYDQIGAPVLSCAKCRKQARDEQ